MRPLVVRAATHSQGLPLAERLLAPGCVELSLGDSLAPALKVDAEAH